MALPSLSLSKAACVRLDGTHLRSARSGGVNQKVGCRRYSFLPLHGPVVAASSHHLCTIHCMGCGPFRGAGPCGVGQAVRMFIQVVVAVARNPNVVCQKLLLVGLTRPLLMSTAGWQSDMITMEWIPASSAPTLFVGCCNCRCSVCVVSVPFSENIAAQPPVPLGSGRGVAEPSVMATSLPRSVCLRILFS